MVEKPVSTPSWCCSRWASPRASEHPGHELLEFKRCYDANLPLLDVLPPWPRPAASATTAWACATSATPCASYRDNATAKAMKRMYTVLPEVAMRPSGGLRQTGARRVEAVPIARLEGRIAAVMLVPYPPGIH